MKNGLLLINKPKGITSFDVIQKVRKKINVKKVGHSGTLDPFADGLLVLAIGEATKVLQYLIKLDKKYVTELEFGKTSDTHDTEGIITNSSITNYELKIEDIEKVLSEFEGEVNQRPPRYSAVKIDGKRACDRVRAGEEVKIKSKKVFVHSITLQSNHPLFWDKTMQGTFKIHCNSGFYVRSFTRDLGEKLGCGAICTKLKRTKIGNFSLNDAVNIEDVNEKNIIKIKPEHFEFSSIQVSVRDVENLRMGRKLKFFENDTVSYRFQKNNLIAAFYDDELVAIGEKKGDYFQPRRVIKR